ncbi:polysaccharide biosynthesis/export family protein [uncultured Microscilla sp.]|uniref:polysaccharide biosynthesis/export family protein n=1 Tax=uncultured Microscilla sp. TaxID=432653 RepID=UPI0026300729|nr:polysaccharide biosynthesis/export family protein [uncultured Microscilla sp.]
MKNLYLIGILAFFGACRSYNPKLFRTESKNLSEHLTRLTKQVEKNYTIQKNDFISVSVYTNDGEIIILPPSIQQLNITNNNNNNPNNQLQNQFKDISFLVKQDGFAKLPMVGNVRLEGFTLNQADSLLQTKYSKFYAKPFVLTNYTNKRVIVLKGNQGVLYPLRNEKVNLVEVVAATGGMSRDLKTHNIRLIRGDLQNPKVFLIDLSTIDGLTYHNLTLEPNDIIYIEPIRRPFLESFRDVSSVLTVFTSLITTILLAISLSR